MRELMVGKSQDRLVWDSWNMEIPCRIIGQYSALLLYYCF